MAIMYTWQTLATSSINWTFSNEPFVHALHDALSLVNEPLYPGMLDALSF